MYVDIPSVFWKAVPLQLCSPAGSRRRNSPCHMQYITTVKGADNDVGPVMFHAS